MTYEKQLEDKIEKLISDVASYQEVIDDLSSVLNESFDNLKLSREKLDKATEIFYSIITKSGMNFTNSCVDNEIEYGAYSDLLGCGAIIDTIIDLIENKLDDYGMTNDK